MIGYIIKDKNNNTLTKNLIWYPRDDNEGLGYVFSENVLKYVKQTSFDWPIQPYSYQKAEYNDETGEVKYLNNDIRYF